MLFQTFAQSLRKLCQLAYPGVGQICEFQRWADDEITAQRDGRFGAAVEGIGTVTFTLVEGGSFGTVSWRHSQWLSLGVSLVRVDGRWLLAVVYVCDLENGCFLDWVEESLGMYFLRPVETSNPEHELWQWLVAQCSNGRTTIH